MSATTRHGKPAVHGGRSADSRSADGGMPRQKSAILAEPLRDSADGIEVLRRLGVLPRMRHPNRRGKNVQR